MAEQSSPRSMSNATSISVPPWIWAQIVTLLIVIGGAVYVTGTVNGRFEEFRTAVFQRLDRLERVVYERAKND